MRIWITRHGQTELNRKKLMQGLTDEKLNDTGRSQARAAREMIGDIKFDAVYASPLDRAIETATIIGNVPRNEVITDARIIEADFGRYEKCSYYRMGAAMTLFWALPELFKAPRTVESISHMVRRSHAFMRELEEKDYNDVLIVCHGGIIRALCGYLEDSRKHIKWRPKPHNCEIRVYGNQNNKHSFLKSYRIKKVAKYSPESK